MEKFKEKIKSRLRKMQSSYTIGVHKQPLIFTVLLVFVINLIILIVAAIIANVISPDYYGSFFNAFAQGSIRWLITPNSILHIDDTNILVLAGIVVVVGIVLFSGVVIAMTTNYLKDYFTKKSSAEGKLILEDHIIIFNWNNKVPQIIEDLMYTCTPSTVLVYSTRAKDFVQTEINNVLKESKRKDTTKVNVIVKTGNPINKSGLKEISIEHAKSIIIMAREDLEDTVEKEINNSDLFTIKTLICVGSMPLRETCGIIVEVSEIETVNVIKDMAKSVDCITDNHIIPIAFNRRLGQFISQFILNPGLEAVYAELFSFQGSEFYPIEKMSIDEALQSLSAALPIFEAGGKLIVLSDEKDDAIKMRAQKLIIDRKIKLKERELVEKYTIAIVGQNSKKRYILESLNNFKSKINPNLNILSFDKDDNEFFDYLKNTEERCVVMILSDEAVLQHGYDSNVYLATIKLQNILANKKNINIIVELLDPINHDIIKDFNVENTIVSNKLISLMITQLATNPEKYLFFEKLIAIKVDEKEVFDVKIDKVGDMIEETDLEFFSYAELVSACYYSSDKHILLIGMISNGKKSYFCSKLGQEKVKLNPEDKLIYIQY